MNFYAWRALGPGGQEAGDSGRASVMRDEE
jgi:hypothetical protein